MDFARLRAALPALTLREIEFLNANFELLLRAGAAAKHAVRPSPWVDETRTAQLVDAAVDAINAAKSADAAAEDARARRASEALEAKYGPKPPLDPVRAVMAPAAIPQKHEGGTCAQCGGAGGLEACPTCSGNGFA